MWMDIVEFRDKGYLQEVNRQFLHPLGLSLVVKTYDDGRAELAGIWDARDDPEGIAFKQIDAAKADNIALEWEERAHARLKGLGYIVQGVIAR